MKFDSQGKRENWIIVNFYFNRDFNVSCEDYKIDGKEWYHYFLCGYKVYKLNMVMIYIISVSFNLCIQSF